MNSSRHEWSRAPLPFRGQKCRWQKQIKEAALAFKGDTVVDLFGGSFLCSRFIKDARPGLRVVCNDFDGFADRIRNIPEINMQLMALKRILMKHGEYVNKKRIVKAREEVLAFLKRPGIDLLIMKALLLFSGKDYKGYDSFVKNSLWAHTIPVYPICKSYLEGIEFTRGDFMDVYRSFRGTGALFVMDPPYLGTRCGGYSGKSCDFSGVREIMNRERFVLFEYESNSIVKECRTYDKKYIRHVDLHNSKNSIFGSNKNEVMLCRIQ